MDGLGNTRVRTAAEPTAAPASTDPPVAGRRTGTRGSRDLATLVRRLTWAAGIAAVGLVVAVLVAWVSTVSAQRDAERTAAVAACDAASASGVDPEEAYGILSAGGVDASNAAAYGPACAEAWEAARKPASPTADAAAAATVACQLAARLLREGDASGALTMLQEWEVESRAACPGAWEVAAALASPAAALSESQQIGKGWDAFVKNSAEPLSKAAVFVLGGWLSLFVLARLLVETPIARALTSSTSSRADASRLGWTGVLGVPVAAAVLGLAFGLGWVTGGWVVLAFLLLAAIGVCAAASLAGWLGTLVKATITVNAKDGVDLTAAHVVARLRAIAEPGGAVELKTTATMSDVDAALTSLSKSDWVATIQKILLFIVGVTPWQITVDLRGAGSATVMVARNGRTTTVRRILTGIAAPPALEPIPAPCTQDVVLGTFIAAEILMSLREAYAADFAVGLNGATKATSIALQYIAVTWYMDAAPAQAVALLRSAVAIDPADQLSLASLKRAQFRRASDIDDLLAYGSWLDWAIQSKPHAELVEPPDGIVIADEQLKTGLVISRVTTARNLAAVVTAPGIRELPGKPSGAPAATSATTSAPLSSYENQEVDAPPAPPLPAPVPAPLPAPVSRPQPPAVPDPPRDPLPRNRRARTHHAARAAAAAARTVAEQTARRWETVQGLQSRAAVAAGAPGLAERGRGLNEAWQKACRTAKDVADAAEEAASAAQLALDARELGDAVREAGHAEDASATAIRHGKTAKGELDEVTTLATRILATTHHDRVVQAVALARAALESSHDEGGKPLRAAVDREAITRAAAALTGQAVTPARDSAELVKEILAGTDASRVWRDPSTAYILACLLVRWEGVSFDDPVVRRLWDVALTNVDLARAVDDDAELATTADPGGYAALVARAAGVVAAAEAEKKPKPE